MMVAPGTTSLLRPNVEKWNTAALTDFATAISTANNDTFQVNIDNTKKFFTDAGNSWQGAAYNAAYDRIGEDHDQARKVWAYVDDLCTAIKTGAADIDSHRTVLMNKVADATAAGLRVADNWVVCENDGVAADVITTHQDAINAAFHPFSDAVAGACTKIAEAAELVRSAGDLFGSDLDVNDAGTQGGRLGDEDGREAADAARNGDQAKLDEVAAHLPTYVLTPDQIQALSEGKDVSTLPAEVQDYYRHFFNAAGKDGLLALNDHLQEQATATSDHPASTVAAAQQRALADGMMAITNEHLGTGTGPDGKLTSPGAYTNLPSDIRQVLSGRAEERNSEGTPSPGANRQAMMDKARLANLLSKSDPNMLGGTTFSMEAARQGASLANYVDNVDKNMGGVMPPGFQDGDKDALRNAASQLLGTGVRNHVADYQLMTGLDATTGAKIPDDLSFGAQGDKYLAHGDYDPQKFNSVVFGHDWGDQGKVASNLYGWTADHAHEQGPEGDLARKTMSALPSVFAPHDGDKLITDKDGKQLFQQTVENFNKNPELANALARVDASNIDAFSQVGSDPHAPKPAAPMEVRDAQRMAFLASQTREGRETIDLARQTYDNATLYSITHGGTAGDVSAQDAIQKMASLDGIVGDAQRNALIYQDHSHVADENEQAQKSHDDKQEIGDKVKKVVDMIPVPGGKVVGTVKDFAEDPAYKALMEGVNPKPTPQTVQYPSVLQVEKDGQQDFRDRLDSFNAASGQPLDQSVLDNYRTKYDVEYQATVSGDQVHDNDSLDQLVTGGAQAPDNPDVKK
ncbi:hypothetical protein ACIBQ0_23760 [Nocardia nova]|uniref:TPR repeat region-containing protein n=1 Tax=Nocardia nova TaxID=37330 RepID=UPI003798F618